MEKCLQGSALPSYLPTLATPRAKKKKKKEEEGAAEAGNFSENSDLLWREYFRDPSQWWDMRRRKTTPGSPDFIHKLTKESLCIHGLYSPLWVQEKLKRKDLHSPNDEQDAEHDVKRKKKKRQVTQNAPILNNGNHSYPEDDMRVAISYVATLKACAKQKDLQKGRRIHTIVDRRGLLQNNMFIGSSLVNMYAKCGALEIAQEVFDKLPQRNIYSWNALMAGYAQQGHGKKALSCFERMQLEGLTPDAVTFTCALKACGSIGDLFKGEEIHVQILKGRVLEKDIMVANTLVYMYAKCGALEKAQEILDELPDRDIVSWTALITGYAQHQRGEDALHCFEQMQLGGVSPDGVTYACILKACGSVGALEKGAEIHAKMKRECLLGKDVVISNALIDMYVKCGALEKAQEVFDELLARNVISWNGLIAGYTQHGRGEEAMDCFKQMQREGCSPDAVTFATILKACGILRDSEQGQEIHAQIVREHLLERDIVVAGALVDMYAKCGNLEKAQEVFDELSVTDLVSWTSLIGGYVEHGYCEKALNCFRQMQLVGISPNAITFSCILKACGNLGALDEGQEIHAQIAKEECYLERDNVVGTALVDMYARCNAFEKAQEVFDNISVLDVVLWNTLIAGFVQRGHFKAALGCFEQMQHKGFSPDAATFASLLKVCGSVGSADMGLRIHSDIVKCGLMDKITVLDTLLVIMYADCGMLIEAEEVFGGLAVRDVVSWSVLMAGYAQLGKDKIVLHLFDKMIGEGIVPTSVTFTIILNACSHRGLVEEGQFYFQILSKAYGIIPTIEHHCCMVDLFGRAGHLDNAVALIEKMPLSADSAMLHTLLVACKNSVNNTVNNTLGIMAFEHAMRLDENDDAAYVCMGDIFAAVGGSLEEADQMSLCE